MPCVPLTCCCSLFSQPNCTKQDCNAQLLLGLTAGGGLLVFTVPCAELCFRVAGTRSTSSGRKGSVGLCFFILFFLSHSNSLMLEIRETVSVLGDE